MSQENITATTFEPFTELGQGAPTEYVNPFGEKLLYDVNRSTFDRLSARDRIHAELGQVLIQEDRLHIIVGSDSGHIVQYLRGIERPESSRYLIVELEPVIDWLDQQGLLTDLPEDIAVSDAESWFAIATKRFKLNEYIYIDGAKIHSSFAARDAYLTSYIERLSGVTETVQQFRYEVMIRLGYEPFIKAQLQNVCENIHPIQPLAGLFAGRTAVILAGGPSLDALLPWVVEHRDKLIVLAVSRVSRRLLQIGLEPDFVVSVDPQERNLDVSREMMLFSSRVMFINNYHVSPLLLGSWPHRNFYLGYLFPWKTALNKPNLQGVGPTVTNSALQIAGFLGIETIILAGVDFCFDRQGFTHAAGSMERDAGPRLDLPPMQVETYGGWMASIHPGYIASIANFSKQAAVLQSQGCRIINASEGAARIETIEYLPANELPLPAQPVDAHALVEACLPAASIEVRAKHLRMLTRELARAAHAVEQIRDLSEQALMHNERFYQSQTREEALGHKSAMDGIEKTFKRKLRVFSRLTMIMGVRNFLKIARPFRSEAYEEDFAQHEADLKHYYQCYRDGAKRLLELIRDAQARTASRLEELNPGSADIQALIAQWAGDQHYGRARMWLKTHRNSLEMLDAGSVEALRRCELDFEQQLASTDKGHMKLAKSFANPKASITQARIFFQRRNDEGLASLILALSAHPDQDAISPYLHFARGAHAQLNGELDEAIAEFLEIIETAFQPLLEDTLKHVASIYLTKADADGACAALEALSLIAPIHRLHYADLLHTLGRTQEALDGYHEHVRIFPGDRIAQLKLAHIYASIGAHEAAEVMLTHILKEEPDNTTAQRLLETARQRSAPPL
ncbi:MAG: 6-hydroxymethylpterin diphosphokinase MptE-like protein [Pseudomonadota bacterium]